MIGRIKALTHALKGKLNRNLEGGYHYAIHFDIAIRLLDHLDNFCAGLTRRLNERARRAHIRFSMRRDCLEVGMIRDRAACMIGSRSMNTQNRNLPLQEKVSGHRDNDEWEPNIPVWQAIFHWLLDWRRVTL